MRFTCSTWWFDASTILTNATGRFNDYVNTGQDRTVATFQAWLTRRRTSLNPEPNHPADWQLFQEGTGTARMRDGAARVYLRVGRPDSESRVLVSDVSPAASTQPWKVATVLSLVRC